MAARPSSSKATVRFSSQAHSRILLPEYEDRHVPMLEHEVNLYYTEAGEGETILFCHGAAGNAASWFNQFGLFAKDYRCVAYDCRGFGRSVCTAAQFDGSKFAADAVALLDHLDIASACFVCQSMGGWTGVRAALDFPDRVDKLVLSGTIGGIALASGIESFQTYRERGPGTSIAASGFAQKNPAGAFLHAQLSDFNRLPQGTVHAAMFDEVTLVPIERAQTITQPILILSGRGDVIWPPAVLEELAGLLPSAERFEIDSGHSPHLENPDLFNRVLREFLARSPENAPG